MLLHVLYFQDYLLCPKEFINSQRAILLSCVSNFFLESNFFNEKTFVVQQLYSIELIRLYKKRKGRFIKVILLFDIIMQKLCDAVPTITFIFKEKI